MGSKPTKFIYILSFVLGFAGIISLYVSEVQPYVSWANFVPNMNGSFLFTAAGFVLLWIGVTFKGL